MTDSPELTHRQAMRYSRHVMLPSVDFAGQERIVAARILVVGVGGLGCAALPYLASSGVGHLCIADDDKVELHNLQRQTLFVEADVETLKVEAAQARLQQMNSDCEIHTHAHRVDEAWLHAQVPNYDVVLDCTDNLSTRNLINRACFFHRKPLVTAAAIRFEGQLITFTMAPNSPCYGCMSALFGEQQLSCMEAGIFAPVVAQMGIMQALDALKLIAGLPIQSGLLSVFDGLQRSWQQINVPPHPQCPVCAADP